MKRYRCSAASSEAMITERQDIKSETRLSGTITAVKSEKFTEHEVYTVAHIHGRAFCADYRVNVENTFRRTS
jgi:hypothetical protein